MIPINILIPRIHKLKYDMINEIPLWQHLLNNGEGYKVKLTGNDYGVIAERIGTRILRIQIKYHNLINNMFPNIQILSTKKINGQGDYTIEVHYKKEDIYGKKIVLFEIKHGNVQLSQQQTKKYCQMIFTPSEFFKKSDEVKIIYMIFDKIDTLQNNLTYHLCELDEDLAKEILDNKSISK